MASSRVAALDGAEEIGDSAAPYGTEGWVRYLRYWTIEVKRDAKSKAIDLKRSLQSLREDEHWRKLSDSDGRAFIAWEDFCQYPEPWGLGMAMAEVGAILDETDPAKTVAAVLRAKAGRPKKDEKNGDKHNHFSQEERGTGRDYTLARLDRDRPELAARVRAGDLSANAAATEAGFRKPRTPYQELRAAWKRATPDQKTAFASEFAEELKGIIVTNSMPERNAA